MTVAIGGTANDGDALDPESRCDYRADANFRQPCEIASEGRCARAAGRIAIMVRGSAMVMVIPTPVCVK
jgi:hypothetical protein